MTTRQLIATENFVYKIVYNECLLKQPHYCLVYQTMLIDAFPLYTLDRTCPYTQYNKLMGRI